MGLKASARTFYGWKLLAALWVILFVNLAFPMYGLSVLDPYMTAALHLDRTMLGLVFAVFMAMTGIPAPLAAWCTHRFGIRPTLVAGNLLLLASAVAMASFVTSPVAIVLFAGVLLGTSNAFGGPLAAQASVTRWFVRRRSLALAILLTGSGVGGFLAAPLLNGVVERSSIGWRAGWWVIATLAAAASAIAWWLVVERPEDVGQSPDGEPPAVPRMTGAPGPGEASCPPFGVHITREDWSPWQALRSRTFWVLMVAALGFSAALILFLAQGVAAFEDLHHAASAAALALSVSVICGLGANLGVGFLGDRIDPRWLFAALSALDAVGVIALLAARSDSIMFASAAVLGIAGNGCMVCFVTLLGNYYGPRAFAAVFGAASAVQSTLGSVAPVVAGYWYDRHGTYGPVFIAVAVWCAAAAIVLALISPPVSTPSSRDAGARTVAS